MIKHNVCDDVLINEYSMICGEIIYVFVHDDVTIILMLLINASDF